MFRAVYIYWEGCKISRDHGYVSVDVHSPALSLEALCIDVASPHVGANVGAVKILANERSTLHTTKTGKYK